MKHLDVYWAVDETSRREPFLLNDFSFHWALVVPINLQIFLDWYEIEKCE